MIKTLEEALMLEIANSVVRGDDVDFAIGADTDVHPIDFDVLGDEEQVLGLVDLITSSAGEAGDYEEDIIED